MTQGIVDLLEMIEIDAEDGDMFAPACTAKGILQLFSEQCAIWQIGQRVMARHMRNLRLSFPPFGDILQRSHPAAPLLWLDDHPEGQTGACFHGPDAGLSFPRFRDRASGKLLRVPKKDSRSFPLPE